MASLLGARTASGCLYLQANRVNGTRLAGSRVYPRVHVTAFLGTWNRASLLATRRNSLPEAMGKRQWKVIFLPQVCILMPTKQACRPPQLLARPDLLGSLFPWNPRPSE